MTATNFPNGVTNVLESAALGSFIAPAPTAAHVVFDDFDVFYTAAGSADWTVTETQAGATQAITSGDGGLLLLTNTAADDDINAISFANLGFVIDPKKSFWLAARFQTSDVLQTEILFGLVDTMAAFNPANGVYLYKADGAAPVRLSIEKASATTNASPDSPSTGVLNNTMIEVAITFNADEGVVRGWVNGQAFGQITNLTNLPTVALAPAIGIRNGEAVAKTLTVDYIMAAKQR
jgi:hypothetical protein